MKIELHEIPISELVRDYTDDAEEGVTAYGGRLDVRPKYQREFVYDNEKRNAVIDTVLKGFPLNVMYWVENDGGRYEVLDGQQRTISICRYVCGDFSVREKYFHTLPRNICDDFLSYPLMVYFCEGTDSEKLDWFKTINIAGAELSAQELRNAVYTGSWLTDAKRKFSKTHCPAIEVGDKYVNVKVNRQELLELALSWISSGKIEQYMSQHQRDANANELWLYYAGVISWAETVFPRYRREMKGLPWGSMYNEHHTKPLDTAAISARVDSLMEDDEVQSKKGIYAYVLDGREKHLNLRTFDKSVARTVYERQKGVCPICGRHFEIDEMEADHITPWHSGGMTVIENCQMLCREDNRRKSGK